jgi:predicted NBD/HSP70 family sugar kinase
MSPERRADFLTNLPVPDLYPRQLDLFTPKALLAKKSGRFDISEGIGAFNNPNPTKVLVFDIGGTAVKMGEVTVRQGMVVIEENMVATVQSENEGTNYLPAMLRMRDQYPELPVGVSTAGVVDENGDLEISPNLHVFTDNLKEMGGFKNIFGSVSVLNDASAGLTIGGVKVPQQLLRSNLVHVIFSGGIGGAALNKDGDIISMEPGHIPVIEELNPYQIDKPCGLYSGWDHVCLERVGAVGALSKNNGRC